MDIGVLSMERPKSKSEYDDYIFDLDQLPTTFVWKENRILKIDKYNLPPLKSCLQLNLDDAYYLVHLQQYIFQ